MNIFVEIIPGISRKISLGNLCYRGQYAVRDGLHTCVLWLRRDNLFGHESCELWNHIKQVIRSVVE